jgi:hypothetical protein
LPPGGPLWIPYFLTADARRTAEIAKDNGAMIVHGPMEVTGGDWVFTGIDPQNAMFAAHSKKKVATPTTKSEAAKGAKPAKSSKKTSAKKTTKTVKAKATKTTKATKGTKAAKGSARLQASRKESKKRR